MLINSEKRTVLVSTITHVLLVGLQCACSIIHHVAVGNFRALNCVV